MCQFFNTFIVHKFSNLIYRVETILYKNFGNLDKTINKYPMDFYEKISESIDNININEYVNVLFGFIDELNAFVDHSEIWKHPNKALEIYDNIKSIVYFMEPIIPTINHYWTTNEPIILFKKLELK